MKTLILLFTTAMLSACATTEKYEAKLQSWVGHSEDALVQSWGPPTNTYTTPSGMKTLTYAQGGETQSYGYYNQLTNSVQVNSWTNWCKTTFMIQLERVSSWRWEGNACKSQ